MTQKAKIVITKRIGQHPQGGPREQIVELRMGEKGAGKKLISVQEWPWSPKSTDLTDRVLAEAAEKHGVEIVPGHIDYD